MAGRADGSYDIATMSMPELAEQLRDTLAGRYAVDREIGTGGMAVVLRARDVRHERWVALKVLRPELASTLGAERFIREIRLAAGLHHPHILPVHDSGEAGGLLYYVMPLVEGESLRDRLAREGQLGLDDVLLVAREVAEALHYAHARDIVHRDVKPENILLAQGHAFVADFGIARAISAAGGLKLTETGLAVGTPAYMSPEQAGADDRVDGRADVYALGCVLYEMLVGEPPYRAPTSQGVMAQHATAPVPSVRQARPSVPEHVDLAIRRAMAKAPADRFASAEALAAALRPASGTSGTSGGPAAPRPRRAARVVGAAAMLVLAAGVWAGARAWTGAGSERQVSIAVAPIRNLGDSGDLVITDGLTQELTGALTRVRGVAPRPYASVVAAARHDGNPLDLGKALGVDYVLASTLRRLRGQISMSTELIRVRDGTNVWSPHTFHGSIEDLFRLQDSLTSQIAAELAGTLAPGAIASAGTGSQDPEAIRLYLQARQIPPVSAIGSERAVRLLLAAVARDSAFADAWGALAAAYSNWAQFSGNSPWELQQRITAAADRALALDSLSAEAWGVLAFQSYTAWDFARADAHYGRAIAGAPTAAWVHADYANVLHLLERHDSAAAETRRALRLDPTNSHFVMLAAYHAQTAGRYREADSLSRRALALDPTNWVAHVMLAKAALKERRFADAIAACEQSVRLEGRANPFALGFAGLCFGKAGRRDRAEAMLATLGELSRQRYVERSVFAWARLGLGDRSGALDDLEQAAGAREYDFLLLMRESARDLWAEPRYQALLRRTGLDRHWTSPPAW